MRDYLRPVIWLFTFTIIAYQNCGRVAIHQETLPSPALSSIQNESPVAEGPSQTPAPITQEDSNEQTTEEILESLNCYQDPRLAIWKDEDGSGLFKEENYLGYIYTYKGELSAAENYNYYSSSAHPEVGPTPSAFRMFVFFYEESNGDIYLTTYANTDEGGSSSTTKWDINLITQNNVAKDNVVLSDDGGEMLRTLVDETLNENHYEGHFAYSKNTDGAVIGPFQGQNFGIQFKILGSGDIDNARFYSSDGQFFDLFDPESTSISSFIVKYQNYYVCDPQPEF